MNLVEILRNGAASHGDVPAIVDLGAGAGRTLTYDELHAAVTRAAEVLCGEGLGPGDNVLIVQPMSADLYIALLAVLHGGMCAMFLDPAAGLKSIRAGCRRRDPAAIIGPAKVQFLGLLAAELRHIPRRFTLGRTLPGIRSLSTGNRVAPPARPVSLEASAPALLTFTSGSTAQAKALLRTHGFLSAQYRALESALALEACQVDLTTLPLFLLANLAAGVTSILPDLDLRHPGKAPPERIVEAMRAHGVTRTAASPALLERLADHCIANEITLAGLRQVFTGGAPVFPRVLEKLVHVAPRARVAAVYGSSEAEPISVLDAARIDGADREAMHAGRGLLAGEPVPGIGLRILPDRWGLPMTGLSAGEFDRLVLAGGEVGEILVSGAHVLRGYLDGAGDERTKVRVGADIWHRTGDAGYLDARGRLWLLGRCGTQVGRNADALYPFAVECAASRFPAVRRSALFEDPQAGRVLAVETGAAAPTLEALERALAWAAIDSFRLVRGIPVDARHNAKIDYTRLRRARLRVRSR